jgi:hypothetical protein
MATPKIVFTIGVSIISYAGGVQFGLITDERLCPEPGAISARFVREFEQLVLLTLMLIFSALRIHKTISDAIRLGIEARYREERLRDERGRVGEIAVGDDLVEARYTRAKVAVLSRANLRLEKLRVLLRLCQGPENHCLS